MHNALGVDIRQTVSDRRPDLARPDQRKRALAAQLAQRRALDQRHDDELAALMTTRVEQFHQVRMPQLSQKLNLSAALAGVARPYVAKDLHRDVPAVTLIHAGVDISHATPAQQGTHPVPANGTGHLLDKHCHVAPPHCHQPVAQSNPPCGSPR